MSNEVETDPFWRELVAGVPDGPFIPVGHDGQPLGLLHGAVEQDSDCPWTDGLIPGPIEVTVDDEHAQPVTGWVLRLPGEMGGGWVVRDPWSLPEDTCWSGTVDALRDEATIEQKSAAMFTGVSCYEVARWWAAAYSTVLREEQK